MLRPSTLPSSIASRRPSKTRIYQEDALSSFSENDKITEWNKLNSKHSGFLTTFQKCWTVSNSKQQFSPNKLGNAIICDDGKTTFFRQLADWIELWQKSPYFTLSKQTSSALITTLRS